MLAGLTVGAAWFGVLYAFTRRTSVSTYGSLFLIAASGLLTMRLGVSNWLMLLDVLRGDPANLLGDKSQFMPHWRIISPALSLWTWLLYLGALHLAVLKPTRLRLFCASLALRLLFHSYFYYWTAAGLGLGMAMALDRRHWTTYVLVGVGGMVVGAPAWLGQVVMQGDNSEFLLRSDKFVPIARFSELITPRLGFLTAIASFAWVWSRDRTLLPLWTAASASLLLLNHQVVTGLQIENAHWLYVWCPALALLIVVLVAKLPAWRSRRMRAWSVALLVMHMTIGGVLRWQEAGAALPNSLMADYQDFKVFQRTLQAEPPAMRRGAYIAGDVRFVDWAAVFLNAHPLDSYSSVLSPNITNAEWNHRLVLNTILEGVDDDAYAAYERQRIDGTFWGPWSRSTTGRDRLHADRVQLHAALLQDIDRAVAAYDVGYVVRRTDRPAFRDWRLVARTDRWAVYAE